MQKDSKPINGLGKKFSIGCWPPVTVNTNRKPKSQITKEQANLLFVVGSALF